MVAQTRSRRSADCAASKPNTADRRTPDASTQPDSQSGYPVMVGRPVHGSGVGFSPKSVDDMPESLDGVSVMCRCRSRQEATERARFFNEVMMQLDCWSDFALPAWAFTGAPLEAPARVEAASASDASEARPKQLYNVLELPSGAILRRGLTQGEARGYLRGFNCVEDGRVAGMVPQVRCTYVVVEGRPDTTDKEHTPGDRADRLLVALLDQQTLAEYPTADAAVQDAIRINETILRTGLQAESWATVMVKPAQAVAE